jgi:DNA helicase IV
MDDPQSGGGRTVSNPEIEHEQRHVDAAYEALDAARVAARSVVDTYRDVERGGTHQSRLERDAAIAVTGRRLTQLRVGDAQLAFGRLDLHDDRLYVGRVALADSQDEPILIDWRAPVAEPFYRATARHPMGVVRRRHLVTRGRVVTGLDDEVFDQDRADELGLVVMGDGALLGSLDRARTGRMRDIVATIQADQDQAIRAPLAGLGIVLGGPGTGKTAVALHRAAYLLYTHRAVLAGPGVLLVGPNTVFLRYIEQVLPSLGEDGVVLTTPSGLDPRRRATSTDPDRVAALKGDVRMAALLVNALADRQRPLRKPIAVPHAGHLLRISVGDSQRIVGRARHRRGTHNARRRWVARAVVDLLFEQHRASITRAGRGGVAPPERIPTLGATAIEGGEPGQTEAEARAAILSGEVPQWYREEFGQRMMRHPMVREALFRMWPDLSPEELLHDLLGSPQLLARAARGVLSDEEAALLRRRRSESFSAVAWTDADLLLLDELVHPLGPRRDAKAKRAARPTVDADALDVARRVVDEMGLRGQMSAADLAARFAAPDAATVLDPDDEPREYGHVLVDEAQDLTPMQWRALARRCPSGSMTLVGDFGQVSRPGACANWTEVLSHLRQGRDVRRVELTVNYRTPAEVMDVANRLLAVAAPDVTPTRAVRSTGRAPAFLRVAAGDLVARAAAQARQGAAEEGTVAVVAPARLVPTLVAELADVGARASGTEALDAPVAVLGADEVKGLEFDVVVVVEPAELAAEGVGERPIAVGLRRLFVAVTRSTRHLVVVHASDLPPGLAPTPASGGDGGEEGIPEPPVSRLVEPDPVTAPAEAQPAAAPPAAAPTLPGPADVPTRELPRIPPPPPVPGTLF